MKYQSVKSPCLLVIFVIAPGCRVADVRDRGSHWPTDHTIIRSDNERKISVEDSRKDGQIPVDGVVELY